jgi:hypothetical protein
MSRPYFRAIIDDGPRQGETIVLDPDAHDAPPHEIMLPDGHAGMRPQGRDIPHPTGSVSRYRLVRSDDGSEYHYRVVPHEN